jgi:hypothetical protein
MLEPTLARHSSDVRVLVCPFGVPPLRPPLESGAGSIPKRAYKATMLIERRLQLARQPLKHAIQMDAFDRMWIALTSEASSRRSERTQTNSYPFLLATQG